MVFKDLLFDNEQTEVETQDINKAIFTENCTIQVENMDGLFYECALQVNAYINATLTNGCNIDGQIDAISENGFMIDDNITGDIFFVNFAEVETLNEYIQ